MKLAKIVFVVMIALLVINLGLDVAEAACDISAVTITPPGDGEVIDGEYLIKWSDLACTAGETVDIKIHWDASSWSRIGDDIDANEHELLFDTDPAPSLDKSEIYWLELLLEDGAFSRTEDNRLFTIDNYGPEQVTGLIADQPYETWSSDNTVVFTWDVPDDVGTSGLAGYKINCVTDGGPFPGWADAGDETYACEYEDGDFNRFNIRSVDNNENEAFGILITQAFWIDTTDPWFNAGGLKFLPNDGIPEDDMFFRRSQTIGIMAYVGDATSGVAGVTADISVIDPDWSDDAPFTYDPIEDRWILITDSIDSDIPEGEYTIPVRVTDLAGNSRGKSLWMMIDNIEPVPTLRFSDSEPNDGNVPGSERVIKDGDDLRIYVDFIEEGSGVKEKNYGADPTIEINCPDGVTYNWDLMEESTNVWYVDLIDADLPDNGWEATCDVRIEGADWANNYVANSNNGQLIEDAFEIDNTAPVIDWVKGSPGYYNVPNTIYAGLHITDDVGFSSDAVHVKTQDHNGDYDTHFMNEVSTALCNAHIERIAPDAYDVCFGVDLDGEEGQDVRINVQMYDYAGHPATNMDGRDSTIVHTDFIPPTNPDIEAFNPEELIIDADTFEFDLDTQSVDDLEHHWYTYEIRLNGGPWDARIGQTEDFVFNLVQDFDNELCIRGMDLATNPSDAPVDVDTECITVTEDSTSPRAVTDLVVFDALAQSTVTLAWSDVEDPGEYASGVDHYDIYMRKIGKYDSCFESIADPGVDYIGSVDPGVGLANIADLYESRTYCFAVVAVDAVHPVGNFFEQVHPDFEEDVLMVVPGAAYPNEQIDLIDDWNFISTPVILLDNSIDSVFVNTGGNPLRDETNIVWHYDSLNGRWLSWVPDAECVGDSCLTTFEHGRSYLVDMNQALHLELSGRYLGMLGGGEMLPEYAVYDGWNMIGYTKAGNETTSDRWDYFRSLAKDPIVVLTRIGQGLAGVSEMTSGAGYWVNVDMDDTFAPGYNGIYGPDETAEEE
jgi:hypothetical protein